MGNERPDFLDWAFDEARHATRRSKDPTTVVGAAIFRPNRTLVSKGYNGLPRGVNDSPERLADRKLKNLMTVHAEMNAILTAHGGPLDGCTIYSTFFPCSTCAGAIIQAGITCVVAPDPTPEQVERWGDAIEASRIMFAEAGVEVVRYEPPSDVPVVGDGGRADSAVDDDEQPHDPGGCTDGGPVQHRPAPVRTGAALPETPSGGGFATAHG